MDPVYYNSIYYSFLKIYHLLTSTHLKVVVIRYTILGLKVVFVMSDGGGYGEGFALIVVLFILLIIVGTAYGGGYGGYGGYGGGWWW